MMGLRRSRPMGQHTRKRPCTHGKGFFDPAPRHGGRHHSGSQPLCRQASKAASHRRWLRKPDHRPSVSGPTNVARVRQWRHNPPGSWRRQTSQVSDAPDAFQDPLTPHPLEAQQGAEASAPPLGQDACCMHPAGVVGFLAPCTGLSFQEASAVTARRLQQLGRALLHRSPPDTGGLQNAHPPPLWSQAQPSAHAVQVGGAARGP
jgi:hypothetical protein